MNKAVKISLRFAKKSLSVLLAFLMMLSVCVISGFSVSAAGSCVFSSGDYIYVSTVNASSIGINDKIKCHMYTGWPEQSGTYYDSVDMQKISSNYYRCIIMGDNVKYLKFKLNDSDWWISNGTLSNGNSKTQFSVDTNDTDNNPCYSKTNNCLYINNTSANSASWGSINANDPDNTLKKGVYSEKTAELSSNITSRLGKEDNQLTLVKGTFYDYYNNDEIRNGWITGLDGSERDYKDREPFTFFNNAVSGVASGNSSWIYPLYFGDFNRTGTSDGGPGPWTDGYSGAGVSNLTRYNARANNSNMTSSGLNGAVSGLVDSSLSGGSTGTVTSGGVTLPYFSKSFLKNGYGAVVNSQFPFRNEVRNGDTYHVYDSTDGKDNFFFENPSGSPTAVYYNNDKKIYDAASGFGNNSNGVGFFPFDNPSSHMNNAYDFGFGMKLEIPFVLRADGKTANGNDVKFNFSGDDDLWVYIDGQLVLDMGGAHKKATGSINFTQKSATVNSLDTTLGTKTTSLNNVEWGKAHTMTVFYMERGMIESNCKIEYNFDVLDNLLTVEKEVDTANVNSGIKSAVANTDTFDFTNTNNTTGKLITDKSFTIYDNSLNKESNGAYSSDGKYSLDHKDKASFPNVAEAGNNLTVSEQPNSSNIFNYTKTKYTVTDVQNSKAVQSGSSTSASFTYLNSVDENQMTNYNVKFINTPQVSDLSVSKTVKDAEGKNADGSDSTKFDFSVALSLDGTDNYKTYPLVYEVDGTTYTTSNGSFKLSGGQTAVFTNIPVGTKYSVTETANTDYTTNPSNRNSKGAIGGGSVSNKVVFTNTKINKSPASVDIQATKLLDGVTPDVNTFEFALTELTKNGSSLVKSKEIQSVYNSNENVIFDTLQYEYIEPETTQPVTTAPVTQPTTVAPTTTQPATTEPVSTNTVYLKPNSNWTIDNAWFAIYVFNGSSNSWAKMTSAGNGYYKAEIPDGSWSNIIFCRMNPNSTTLAFSNCWNQTNDLTIPSGSNKCYTVADGAWSYGNGSWGAIPSSASVKAASALLLTSTSAEKYYYMIEENIPAVDETYDYDSSKYYVVVTVNRSQTPITAAAKYYFSASDAIAETNEIQPEDVKFNNYHKGSLEITKKNGNGAVITDSVAFSLYTTDKYGGDISESTLVSTKTVDENGKVKFENLKLFVNQDKNDTSQRQWYCFVETTGKENFNINSEKHYFTVPRSVENADQSSDSYDFISNGKRYSYVPGDDNKPIYNITCDVDNFPIVSPDTSGSGTKMFLFVGLGVISAGALTGAGYILYDRKQRKRRRAGKSSQNS